MNSSSDLHGVGIKLKTKQPQIIIYHYPSVSIITCIFIIVKGNLVMVDYCLGFILKEVLWSSVVHGILHVQVGEVSWVSIRASEIDIDITTEKFYFLWGVLDIIMVPVSSIPGKQYGFIFFFLLRPD